MGLCKECVAFHLGACRDLSYCLQERKALMEEAYQRIQTHGHAKLSPFTRWREGYSIFEAHCLACGMAVRIDVNPGVGEPDIFGEALLMDCPGISAARGIFPDSDTPSVETA
ncbi:MAG: hypothetical protein NZ765_10525 [Anaerolineae bacterium]|nr:hypothetical protein [Anaerolineae bacterium]MDW8071096.1 hypothetical protein [Anaerolineae bacterium]